MSPSEVRRLQQQSGNSVDGDGWRTVYEGTQPVAEVNALAGGVPLLLRVRAVNSAGSSPWCTEVEVTPKQNPVRGGGRGKLYEWTQSSSSLEIRIPNLSKGTTSKDVQFVCRKFFISLTVNNMVVFRGVPFGSEGVRTDETFWQLDRSPDAVSIVLEVGKFKSLEKWACVVVGEPEVDIRKVTFFDPKSAASGNLPSI
mmetsp:Transcript_74957/g.199865  ORF Transcript_74957/g.199865 Transcript_74957/m.199865 type:complete len:198 (+) Transcript_74957:374-967(+)